MKKDEYGRAVAQVCRRLRVVWSPFPRLSLRRLRSWAIFCTLDPARCAMLRISPTVCKISCGWLQVFHASPVHIGLSIMPLLPASAWVSGSSDELGSGCGSVSSLLSVLLGFSASEYPHAYDLSSTRRHTLYSWCLQPEELRSFCRRPHFEFARARSFLACISSR